MRARSRAELRWQMARGDEVPVLHLMTAWI